MINQIFKKTALALFTGCLGALIPLASMTANAQTIVQETYVAPGESDAVAASKPSQASGTSVKEKAAKKKVKQKKVTTITKTAVVPTDSDESGELSAIEQLKAKVENDQTAPEPAVVEAAPAEPQISEMARRITFGENVQDWVANSGETVQSLLTKWSEESGWTLVWKLDRDYILEAGVVFHGTYMDVSMALIRSFARATPAPIGTFYKGNRVLVVSTREDENDGQ